MAGTVKFIVNELSKTPFNLDLNVVSFNGLQTLQLLQLLSDVLCDIEGKERIDISAEPVEQLAVRLLTTLQILNYRPTTGDPDVFRQGLVSGETELVHPLLHWLLSRREELKKRAYLSRYLVKVEIPAEMRTDSDVAEIYEQYEQLIEEFKQTHRLWDSGRVVSESVAELRRDLQAMEDDREVLTRRIERIHRKVEHVPNSQQLLLMARKLRWEKEKSRELEAQKQQQQSHLELVEAKRVRLQQKLAELRQSDSDQNILRRLGDAVRLKKYAAEEKLPKEMAVRGQKLANLDRIVNMSAGPKAEEFEQLQEKLQELNRQIASLEEKRALEKDPVEDGMALYRQQASAVARKKEKAGQQLTEMRQEVYALEAELKVKEQQMKESGTDIVLTGEKLKVYVGELRNKSLLYKQRRLALNDLKAEFGILSRTLEILRSHETSGSDYLNQIEEQQGVQGYRETQQELEKVSSEKAATDEEKDRTLQEFSHMVHALNVSISEKKANLAPLLRELRPLRAKYQESLPDYESKKRIYDAEVEAIEKSLETITTAKTATEAEINRLEQRRLELEAQLDKGRRDMERANEELKLYVSGVADGKGRSVRDRLQQQIVEQEKTHGQLQEEQRHLKEQLPRLESQVQHWQRLEKIFKVKTMCLEREKQQEGTVRREVGRETLVLQ